MGDRTNASITIYSCPLEQVHTVLGIIDNEFGENDYGDYNGRQGVLDLGGTVGAWEVSCGTTNSVAVLMKEAPGAAYLTNEDPYADWLGGLYAYTPELGIYSAECDANGIPQFTATNVRAIIQMTPEEQAIALGEPWLDGALQALLPPEAWRLLPALPDCDRCGGEWGGDLTCQKCVSLFTQEEAEEQHRVIVGKVEGGGLVYVVARPTAITYQCSTCTKVEQAHLGTRTIEVATSGYWPSDAEAHTAHRGFAKGMGTHGPEAFEIKEVTV